jgi:hypothetical protein
MFSAVFQNPRHIFCPYKRVVLFVAGFRVCSRISRQSAGGGRATGPDPSSFLQINGGRTFKVVSVRKFTFLLTLETKCRKAS